MKLLGIYSALMLMSYPLALAGQIPSVDSTQTLQQSRPAACIDPTLPCPEDSTSYPGQTSVDSVGRAPSPSDDRYSRSGLPQTYPQDFQSNGIRPSAGSPYAEQGTNGTNPGSSLDGSRYGEPSRTGARTYPPDPPTEFQNFVAATLGQRLPLYGTDLFRNASTSFSPNERAPVTPEYVLGPGDEVQVRIWGQINYTGNLTVNRSGVLYIPQIGSIPVAGMTFAALDSRVRSAVGKIYRNFDLSVDLGRLRAIQVYLAGQARQPGAYTLSSLSTLVDALFAAGGPNPQGSLRHIQLRREGKTIADFDLYDLLLRGDKSHDVRLLSEDVLYIPSVGAQAAIAGSVRSPAIFELKTGESFADLVQLAGGVNAVAAKARLSVDRVDGNRQRGTVEISYDPAGLAAAAKDGDIVIVSSILPAYNKTVTVRGNVANPGRFAWHENMKVSDLIQDRDALLSRDYWWKRSHLGLPALEFEPEIAPPSDLRRDLSPATTDETTTAQRNGSLAASATALDSRNNQASSDPQLQRLRREQQTLGRNEVNLTQPSINWNYAVIERVDPDSLKPVLISFNLGKLVLDHDITENLDIKPGDVLTIFSDRDIQVPIKQQVKYVKLDGEFVHAGYYSVLPGETLAELVRRAGGLTPNAYLYGSQFTRLTTQRQQQERMDEYIQTLSLESERSSQAFALAPSSNGGSSATQAAAARTLNEQMLARLSSVRASGRIVLPFQVTSNNVGDLSAFTLENGDRFIVPFAPNIVSVVGAVYDQNSFVFRPRSKASYYLHLAGGSNSNADWRHAFIIRADGSVVSRNHMEGHGFFKASFDDVELYAGDTIVIPDKTLRPTALLGFIEWSQIFSQLALGAAAINVL